MDIISQRTFYGRIIAILVILNLFALAIVWVQSRRTAPPAPSRDAQNPAAISAALLQREIGLSDQQAKAYEQLRVTEQEDIRRVNDSLDALRLRLADAIFDGNSGQAELDATMARFGALQSRLELLRLVHFRNLVRLCDREQQSRLRPILREVYSRRGAAGDQTPRDDGQGPAATEAPRARPDGGPSGARPEAPPSASDERQGPPTSAEKLDRYAERLALTADQRTSVAKILETTRKDEESFRARTDPSEDQFRAEADRLLNREDAEIMKVLHNQQKSDFEQMIRDRARRRDR